MNFKIFYSKPMEIFRGPSARRNCGGERRSRCPKLAAISSGWKRRISMELLACVPTYLQCFSLLVLNKNQNHNENNQQENDLKSQQKIRGLEPQSSRKTNFGEQLRINRPARTQKYRFSLTRCCRRAEPPHGIINPTARKNRVCSSV